MGIVGVRRVTLEPHPDNNPASSNVDSAIGLVAFKLRHPVVVLGPAIPISERSSVAEFH